MRYTTHFFLQGTYLASSHLESNFRPHSMAYFCHSCGEVWARVSVSGDESPEYWEIVSSPCKQHRPTGVLDWTALPGSFLPESASLSLADMRIVAWARAIEHLPEAVLKREFELTLEWYERKHQDD